MYSSPYEAYPFLSEPGDSLCCDFEILTDLITSKIGTLRSVADVSHRDELAKVAECFYHLNPTLRTFFSLTDAEIREIGEWTRQMAERSEVHGFVLPAGCETACLAHELRVMCKQMVRMMYRFTEQGGSIPDAAFDYANLASGYFFQLALELNREAGIAEIPFVSRNYRIK